MKQHILFGLVLWLLVFTLFQLVSAVPYQAGEFYGILTQGSSPGPVGLNVSAYDGDSTYCGSFIVSNEGYYGLLSCKGDDPDSTEDEGATEGDLITFTIDGSPAVSEGNSTWSPGGFNELNLSFNTPPLIGECENATIAEDTSGSLVQVDLHDCSSDGEQTTSSLNFSVSSQTNSALIDCYVANNQNVTCNDPLANSSGLNVLTILVIDIGNATNTTEILVNVTPVNDAPNFEHNITNQSGVEASLFLYDINCTDVDGDTVSFASNFTHFDINSVTGLISWTPLDNETGLSEGFVTCSDDVYNVTEYFNITIENINQAPVLDPIGTLIAETGVLFLDNATATDPDGDTITFADNTSFFDIGGSTGIFSFTPTTADIGTYTINISVTDGNLTDTEIITLIIQQGPECGDSSCNGDENCATCESDCGVCDSVGEGEGEDVPDAGGGGGSDSSFVGGGGFVRGTFGCQENWDCTPWESCTVDGIQTRTCSDLHRCGTERNKPVALQSCTYVATCFDGIQNQGESGVDCGGPCGPCFFETCFDGEQNQGEEGIDCGGPCPSCDQSRQARLPTLEQPGEIVELLKRSFPWLLLLIVSIMLATVTAGDQIYLRKIRKLPLKEYIPKIRAYLPWRRRMYTAALSIFAISWINMIYLYIFSNNPELRNRFLWVPLSLSAISVIIIFIVVRRRQFKEAAKIKKESEFKRIHLRQTINLLLLESKALRSIEKRTRERMNELIEKKLLREDIDLYVKLKTLPEWFTKVTARREKSIATLTIPPEVKKATEEINANDRYTWAVKNYPEFLLIQKELGIISKAGILEWADAEDYMSAMKDIASDTHLMSVITADEILTAAYNKMVDVFQYVAEQKDAITDKEQVLSGIEGEFIQLLDPIVNEDSFQESFKDDAELVRFYNLLIDLFDHYKKRQELLQDVQEAEAEAEAPEEPETS